MRFTNLRNPNPRRRYFLLGMALSILVSNIRAADWPQFRGIHRDGISPETGLLPQWPQDGPQQLWMADGLGEGWSSAAIANGLVYITGTLEKTGYVFCFDLNGKRRWKKSYGPEWTKSYPGARSTPTVHEGRFYVFSGLGVACCFEAKTGDPIWSRDVFTEFDGKYPRWGMSECLHIDGQKVICTPGGAKASVVALDKDTGKVIWACKELTEPSTYGNPQTVVHNGNRMIVTMLQDSVVAIEAETGTLLWRQLYDEYHIDRKRQVNPNVPIYYKGAVYTTSGYNNGGAMVQLFDDPTKAKRKWIDKTLDTHHGGQVRLGDYIYGSNFIRFTRGNWVCLDWDTGKVLYEDKWLGNKGSLIYAEGMLYCYDENKGEVALVPATSEGFKPVSSFTITQGKGKFWAHPSLSDGRLYIRHGEYLMVYDIKEHL